MPTVRLTRAGVVEAELPLARVDVRLGRATDNDLTLKDPDKTLSRHHAELRREGEAWVYLDLNSANGSWVGDQKVMRQALLPGTTILLGDYQLTVVDALAGGDAAAEDVNATRIVRPGDTAIAVTPAGASMKPARAAAPPAVGGAVAVGAPAPAPAASSSPTIVRRIIIYGSIFVVGAFGVVLALLFRPDPDAVATEEAPAAATAPAESAPATAPAPAAAAAVPVTPPAPVAASPTPSAPTTPTPATPSTPAPAASAPARAAPAAAGGAAASSSARRASRPVAPAPTPAPDRTVSPARPGRDADPDAATIAARSGELPAALQQRRDDIRRRYALGLQHLAARRFAEAREVLGSVSAEAPSFRDVAARLAEADAAMRQQAAEEFKSAGRLESAGEWSDAVKAYERLTPFAAVLPGLAEATERTRTKMHEAGADALTRARQYDSRGRVPEAIAWYQRAVAWLPASHPGLEAAKTRLAQLVNRP